MPSKDEPETSMFCSKPDFEVNGNGKSVILPGSNTQILLFFHATLPYIVARRSEGHSLYLPCGCVYFSMNVFCVERVL